MIDLRQHSLFAKLSDTHWQQLQPHLTTHQATQGETLLSDTSEEVALYGVLTGSVSFSSETPFGPQDLGTLSHDDFFGEMAFIDSQPLGISATAQAPTTYWRLDGQALRALLTNDSTLAVLMYRRFWPVLAEKLNQVNRQFKRFFKGGTPTPPPMPAFGEVPPPARPAWFAPPNTPPTPSVSLDALPMDTETIRRQYALLSTGLSNEEVELLLQRGEEMAIPAEESIFKEGDFGDTLYFILHGEVRISKNIPGVGDEALTVLSAGDIFGEMALVAPNAVRSASSSAHENPALVLGIRNHVLHRLRNQPEELPFLKALCKMMTHRLRESYSKLVSWKMMRGNFF
ncbi:MAG: cyclic nucleotide-binding domain-containing protein [Deltaproteobacteria bacterium]|nr:MAG: cyclic nucleotide-binding domain-containing protein [Deltaproteobacteria bacterium]